MVSVVSRPPPRRSPPARAAIAPGPDPGSAAPQERTGRSEAVVRGSQKAHRPKRGRCARTQTEPTGRTEAVVRGSQKAHRPNRGRCARTQKEPTGRAGPAPTDEKLTPPAQAGASPLSPFTKNPVRNGRTLTYEQNLMAESILSCGTKTVAMESTFLSISITFC